MTTLSGVAGNTSADAFNLAGPAGVAGLYTSGSCAKGLSALFAGPRALGFLSLGSGVPLGGTLTVTTCGLTADDTVLYVGTGCPSWALPFNCRVGNDDAGDDPAAPACPTNPGAATAVLSGVASRYLYIQLGGAMGAAVTSGLAWRYEPPGVTGTSTPSGAGTPTRTRSSGVGSRSRTRSRSASASRSRSRSRSPTPSRSKKPK